MDAGEKIQKSNYVLNEARCWCELHQVKAGLTVRLLKCGIYHIYLEILMQCSICNTVILKQCSTELR